MTDELLFNSETGKETTLGSGIDGQDLKTLFEAAMTWLRPIINL